MREKRDKWKEIVKQLKEKRMTIATMESCTGGGIANEITSISGASAVLRESYVSYCNDAKIKLGVPAEVIEKYTVYSAETAIAMANAVMKQTKSDIAIGVTGQLGRIDPNNPVEKLNCVWYAVCHSKKCVVEQINVPSSERKIQKEYVIDRVAETLLKFIKNLE